MMEQMSFKGGWVVHNLEIDEESRSRSGKLPVLSLSYKVDKQFWLSRLGIEPAIMKLSGRRFKQCDQTASIHT